MTLGFAAVESLSSMEALIVFLVSGVWHGANWTFILWGLLHGVLNCLNRLLSKPWEKLNQITRWAVTFMTVNVLWILFRAETVASAKLFMQKLFCLSDFTIREELYACFRLTEFAALEEGIGFLRDWSSRITGLYLWIFILGAFFIVLNFRSSREADFKPTAAKSLQTVFFMLWSVVSFSGISVFLYFNF